MLFVCVFELALFLKLQHIHSMRYIRGRTEINSTISKSINLTLGTLLVLQQVFCFHVYVHCIYIIHLNTEGPTLHHPTLTDTVSDTTCRYEASAFLFLPYPVCGGWWDVDNQSPWQLLNLYSEQQWHIWHLLKLLLNELVLCRLLEILGFSDFVHKSQNLPSSPPTPCAVRED